MLVRGFMRLCGIATKLAVVALALLFLYGAWLVNSLGLSRAEIEARALGVEASLVPSTVAGPNGRTFDAALQLPLHLPPARVPDFVKNAFVMREDRHFRAWWHIAWNVVSPVRAIGTNVGRTLGGDDRKLVGRSTITVQLVKNLLLHQEQSIPNKFNQIVLAVYLELLFSKDEILTMYLNTAYFGEGVQGVEAAARHYFGRSVGYQPAIDGLEAAMLANSVQRPTYLNPARSRDRVEAQARDLLATVAAAGLDAGPAARDWRRGDRNWEIAPYLYRDVALRSMFPEALLAVEEPVRVLLTIDTEAQLYAEREAAALLARGRAAGYDSAAIVVLEPDGAIAAIATGEDYDGRDTVDIGRISPGSTLKPFLVLCALEEGMRPSSIVHDVAREFRDGWTPKNFDHGWLGDISLRTALMRSRNPPMIEIYDRFGPDCFARALAKVGIVLDEPEEPTTVLGSETVSLLALAGAYASLGQGHRVEPYAVRYVREFDGEPLFRHAGTAAEPLSDQRSYCDLMEMLRAVTSAEGTGRNAAFTHPAWGKTGTSSRHRDALFVGFTGHYVAAVWLGRQAQGAPAQGTTGGELPAETFRALMATLHQGKEPVDLDCGLQIAGR